MKKIFIIIPSASLASPVRGACALANELSKFADTTLVSLKGGDDALKLLNKHVDIIDLGKYKSWLKKLSVFKKILISNRSNKNLVTISIGLSADLLNSMCSNLALTLTSVRGDLPKVYEEKFGKIGKFIAYLHLKRLRKFDHIISMTKSMASSVESYIDKESVVIGNFIDERLIEKYRRKNQLKNAYKFIYTGSLIKGKMPSLLISAISELVDMGIEVQLDILGDGPLLESLKFQASNLSKPHCISFHGFLEKPYSLISNSDVLVLPSLTEGISRSVLEALYLGIPCVIRDIGGSSEIIKSGINGELFQKDNDLPSAMLKAAEFSRSKLLNRNILTLENHRQATAASKFLELIKLD